MKVQGRRLKEEGFRVFSKTRLAKNFHWELSAKIFQAGSHLVPSKSECRVKLIIVGCEDAVSPTHKCACRQSINMKNQKPAQHEYARRNVSFSIFSWLHSRNALNAKPTRTFKEYHEVKKNLVPAGF